MARKPETVFWNRIKNKLKSIPNSYWEKTEAGANVGVPDVIGCVNGRYVAMELKKSPTAKRHAMQIHKINKIKKSGGIGLFVYPENWEETYQFLMVLSKENQASLKTL